MTGTSTQQVELRDVERRSHRRYPTEVDARYETILDGQALQSGRGRVLNISRGGLLLKSSRALPTGVEIELSTPWPAHLGGAGMSLFVFGRTVRVKGECIGVRILRYDFRIQRPPHAAAQLS